MSAVVLKGGVEVEELSIDRSDEMSLCTEEEEQRTRLRVVDDFFSQMKV